MEIKVYGAGCSACHEAYETVMSFLSENGIAADLDYIQDEVAITEAGLPATPAVVIDGEVLVAGRMPRRQELEQRLMRKPLVDMWWKKNGILAERQDH